MAEDQDALFSDELEESPETELPVEQPEVEAPEAVEPEQQPAPEPEAEPEPQQQQRPDAGYVPIGAVLDEREKRKDLERRLAEYERQQQSQAPDPFDDPQAFAQHQQGLVQQAIIRDRFERSNEDAVEKYGEDEVRKAIEWATSRAQANPSFATEYMGKTRPVQWIVQQHQRDALMSDIGDPSKLDDWFAREAAKRGYAMQNATTAAAAPQVATPHQATPPVKVPRSLATQGSGPSDVRDVATGALAAVDAAFPQ